MMARGQTWRWWRWIGLLALVLTATIAQAGSFTHGVLWEISQAGSEPSYLLGTIHAEDPRVTNLPPPVQQAFDRADYVTLEVALTPEALMALGTSMLLMDGRNLRDLVGDELFGRTAEALEPLGIPEAVLMMMKPWAAATSLMTPPSETGMFMDRVLHAQALEKDKPVDGLETVQEQMSVFDDMPMEDQVAMLRDTLDQLHEMDALFNDLLEAYLARDLGRLMELNDESLARVDPKVAESFTRKVIVERNHRMAERMQSRLARGRAFVAVGALHLPGEEGILSLLEAEGYRLRPLY